MTDFGTTTYVDGDHLVAIQPDGSRWLNYPDGTVITEHRDGSRTIKRPDGLVISESKQF